MELVWGKGGLEPASASVLGRLGFLIELAGVFGLIRRGMGGVGGGGGG